MIKCNKCGYENNDGSQICLNCREHLDKAEKTISDSEAYIETNREALSNVDKEAQKVGRTTIVVIVAILAAVILGVVIYFSNLYKPVIDEQLLGSWQYSGYGYTDVWTFEEDGTYDMKRTGTGIFSDSQNIVDWYYRAEDGKIKTSWSKNVNEYVSATYEYQLGVSKDGVQCLILTRYDDGGLKTTEILYKVG